MAKRIPAGLVTLMQQLDLMQSGPEWLVAADDIDMRTFLIVRTVCDALHASETTYLPDGERFETLLDRQCRDKSIAAAFDGSNYAELATQHGLTPRSVRRIIERERVCKK